MRRILVVLVLVLAAAVWPATPNAATGSTTQPAPTSQQADFNNDGADDLAVGVPGQHVGAPPFNSGAVNVLYGSATGLTTTGSQLFTQAGGTVEADDVFAWSLTAGDVDNDGFADLAANGGQIFTQNTPGVPGTAEEEELFGAALATGNPGPAPTATASQARPR